MTAPIKHKHRESDLRKFRNLFPEPKSLRVIDTKEYGFSSSEETLEKIDTTLSTLSCGGKTIRFLVRFPRETPVVELSFLDEADIEHRLTCIPRLFDIESVKGLKAMSILVIDNIRRSLLED